MYPQLERFMGDLTSRMTRRKAVGVMRRLEGIAERPGDTSIAAQ
jgi:hypothetical protein